MEQRELFQTLDEFVAVPDFPDERLALEAVREAAIALKEGNFAVGAVIANRHGELLVRNHNHVFSPVFRSDLHAEMAALNEFEAGHVGVSAADCCLVTSLECCPMCLARAITSGVGEIIYVAGDDKGGMIHLMSQLPDIWKELARRQTWRRAKCSPALADLSLKLFLSTASELDARLGQTR